MKKLNNPLLVYIGFGLFFAVGVFMLSMGFVSVAGCAGYIKVDATVVSVRTFKDDEGNLMAVPTYEYYVNGVRYEQERSISQSASISPVKGDTITIRCNPDNPEEVYDSSIITVIFFIFGVIFGGVGATMFILSAMGKMHWTSRGRRYSGEYRKKSMASADNESADE